MKKFAKFLSILLCVAMLAGLVAMVATAEEGTRDPSEPVAGALPTPDAGYYDGDNNFVSASYQHNDKYIDLNKLVDGELGGVQWRSYQFEYADLKQHGGDLVPAIVFDMSEEPVTLNGLNLWSYTGLTWMVDFRVQAKTSADGEWETIATYTDVNNTENGYWLGGDEYLYYFDETVTAYALQILVDNFDKGSDEENARWVYQLYEIMPMIVEVEDTTPEASNPAADTPSVKGVTLKPQYGTLPIPKYGYYTANGSYGTNDEGWFLVSGWFGQSGDLTNIPSGATPMIEFDFGNKPLTLNGLEIVSSGKSNTMTGMKIEVKTSDDGEWETVYTNDKTFSNSLTVTADFGKKVTAYEMRIVATNFDSSKIYLDEIAPLVEVETELSPVVPNSAELIVWQKEESGEDVAKWTYNVLDAAFDSDRAPVRFGTQADHWAYWPGAYVGKGGNCTPILTMDLTNDGEPTVISEMVLYSFRAGEKNTPGVFSIEAKLEADGEWVVLEQYDMDGMDGWRTDAYKAQDGDFQRRGIPLVAEFDAVAAYELRIVVTETTNDSIQGEAGWCISSIELAGPEGYVPPEKPETTDPETTEPETTEPETTEPEATTPNEGTTSNEKVAPERINTLLGYYTDGVGNDESTFVDNGDGYLLTDGMADTYCMLDPENAGEGSLIAIIMELDEAIKLSAIELLAYQLPDGEGWGDLRSFIIQVWIDDEWVDMETITEWPYNSDDEVHSVTYEYDYPIETAKIRILVYAYYDGVFQHSEITLYEAKTSEPTVPEQPEDPTDPTDPSETPTEPSETPTEPSETPTEPSETPTEPEKPTDPDGSGKTGDITLSILVGMLAISAIGCGIVISKKKEF